MSASVGTAYLEVIPSARGFSRRLESDIADPLAQTGRRAGQSTSKGFGSTFGAGLKGLFAVAGGVAVGQALVGFFKDANTEARESQKVNALTAQVIKTTGGAAKVTAAQVGSLATSLSNKTGVDDEVIQSGANLLLTFKNIRNEVGKGNDIFDQATTVANDMSAALGQDMKSSSIQLGKALNDPLKGITALSRVGVSFTQQQKDQIKSLVESGNAMAAQKIILKELNSEFGGSAAAATNPAQKAAVAWGNLKEKIGNGVLPLVDGFAKVLTEKVIPFVSDLAGKFASAMGGADGFKRALADARPFLTIVGTVIAKLAEFAIPLMVKQFKLTMKVLGVIAKALGAVGQAFMWLWRKAVAPAVRFIAGGVSALMRMFATMLRGLAKVPGFGWAKKAAASLDNAADKALALSKAIGKLKDKRVTVTYYQKKVVIAQGRAKAAELAGGRAFGGPVARGATYLVGERGPELFVPAQAGRIVSNSELRSPGRQRYALTITNWSTGQGYMEAVADNRVSAALEFAS